MKPDYELMMPARYVVVKDDIAGLALNSEHVGGSEYPRTVPAGYEYEDPLSLHAETNLSDFRAKEKPEKNKVKSVKVENMLADFADNSDFLYNAYS